MTIFNFGDYKQFIRDLVHQMPHRGRGQFRQMALHLEVNSTVISQIFRGDRHLTIEQGLKLAQYLGLADLETRYLLNLINKERAGTKDLKDYYLKEERSLAEQSKSVKARMPQHKEITDEHKAMFYSNWYNSGIRMLTAIPGYDNVDKIAEYFKLNRAIVQKAVNFLLETGLCIEKNGKITVGPQVTHIDPKSPLINNHRRNWRMKGLEKINHQIEEDLFFSSPMSLSEKDRELIREELVAAIAKVLKRVEKSPEEKLMCLNIDWFHF